MSQGFASMAALVVALGSLGGHDAHALDEIVGWGRAASGDTIKIKSIDDGKTRRVRLFGIASPEPYQHCETQNGEPVNCGLMSRDALDALMRNKQITCVDLERDVGGVLTGTCYAGDRILNSTLVEGI